MGKEIILPSGEKFFLNKNTDAIFLLKEDEITGKEYVTGVVVLEDIRKHSLLNRAGRLARRPVVALAETLMEETGAIHYGFLNGEEAQKILRGEGDKSRFARLINALNNSVFEDVPRWHLKYKPPQSIWDPPEELEG